MTVRKDEIVKLLQELPEEVDIDELIYRLYLREKLAAAEEDIAQGRTVPADEARRRAGEWSK